MTTGSSASEPACLRVRMYGLCFLEIAGGRVRVHDVVQGGDQERERESREAKMQF